MDFFDDLTFPERMLCLQATKQRVPINGVLELTPLCNMNCDMCYVRLSREVMNQKGRLRTLEEWLDIAKEMQKAGTVFLLLTGGEPLLYPEFKALYVALKKLGMILTINTNGTLLDDEWVQFFAENKPRCINITLYGTSRDDYENVCHYGEGFERVLEGIRLLKEKKIEVKINGTMTTNLASKNKDHMGACSILKNDLSIDTGIGILNIAKALGTACKLDTYLYPASRERNQAFDQKVRMSPEDAAFYSGAIKRAQLGDLQFEKMAGEMRETFARPVIPSGGQMACRAGKSSFVIHWNGQMSACIFLSEPVYPVFELGFINAWNALVNDVAKIRLSEKCDICAYKNVCQTCAACAKLECGCFDGTPEYMCRYTKERMRLFLEEK